MLFSPPLKRGINFAKIRGFKVTDYTMSCRSDTLQGLQFLRCGCGIYAESAEPILSRQPEPLQSLRLHSVTQAPSAGPALTSEVRCRSP